jgi:hypothetical protein
MPEWLTDPEIIELVQDRNHHLKNATAEGEETDAKARSFQTYESTRLSLSLIWIRLDTLFFYFAFI